MEAAIVCYHRQPRPSHHVITALGLSCLRRSAIIIPGLLRLRQVYHNGSWAAPSTTVPIDLGFGISSSITPTVLSADTLAAIACSANACCTTEAASATGFDTWGTLCMDIACVIGCADAIPPACPTC